MSKRPNILWYCTDQQRFDTIAALGNSHIHTPTLDRFCSESVVFTRTYCQSPICTPSRVSFLSGMYPSAIGVNGNGYLTFPEYYENRLITHTLAEIGYSCGLVGKLHLASPHAGREKRVKDGYSYFQYSHDHKGPYQEGHDYAAWIKMQGVPPETLLAERKVNTLASYREGAVETSFGGLIKPTPESDTIPPHLHQTYWCTEKAIDFIERQRSETQPWLLSVNPFDPHPPFDAPWDYFRRYNSEILPGAHFMDTDLAHQQRLANAGIDFQSHPRHPDEWQHKQLQASYYAMIEQIDHEFGRLLDYLDHTEQRENTIIIFMSDHGEMLGDHGLLLKGCRFYEGLVRVPLMISCPARFQHRVSDALVELTDIVPTIYDLAGLDIPYFVQGRSLMSLLNGQTNPQSHRSFVRSEFYGGINFPDQTHATMYRDERWKLVCYHHKDILELYDLYNDPWEHHDLSDKPAYQAIKWQLLQRSFDATVYAHPPQPDERNPF